VFHFLVAIYDNELTVFALLVFLAIFFKLLLSLLMSGEEGGDDGGLFGYLVKL
jgi:hypothetical protein